MLYGRITGLVLSLFLPAFYRHVARHWGGIGLLYLFLLFTLTWIPTLIKTQMSFNEFVQAEFPKVAPKLPPITIKGGKVSSPVPQPLEIKDDNGNVVFVLDTTGHINSLDQTPAIMLVTETKLHMRNQQKIEIHDLAQFPDFEFTADFVQGWLDFIGTWLAVSFYPFCMFGSLIRALVIMFIAAIIGLIVDSGMQTRITFAGLLRMAAVGITLSVYLDTGLGFTDIKIPFWFFIAAGLTSIYVVFGVWATGPPPSFKRAKDDFDDDRDEDDDYRSRRRESDEPRNREDTRYKGYDDR